MTELSKGRIVSSGSTAITFWVEFLFNVWYMAAYAPEEGQSLIEEALAQIKTLVQDEPAYAHTPKMFEIIQALRKRWLESDAQVDIWVRLGGEDFALTAGWQGCWTRGRWVEIQILPDGEITVGWDTGTGKESSFLALPSSAEEWARENPCQIFPWE